MYRPFERRYALIRKLRVISEDQKSYYAGAQRQNGVTICLILEIIPVGVSSLSCLSCVAAAAAASAANSTTATSANHQLYIH
jgi:hypothetical protein